MAKEPKRVKNKDNAKRAKKKISLLNQERVEYVDYKDVNLLRRFISDRAKIKARRTTGTCVQHQRDVAVAIKTAREVALIPYTQRTVSDKAGGREGRGGGRGGPGGGGGRPSSDRPPTPDVDLTANGVVADDDAADETDTPVYAEQ